MKKTLDEILKEFAQDLLDSKPFENKKQLFDNTKSLISQLVSEEEIQKIIDNTVENMESGKTFAQAISQYWKEKCK